MLDKLQKEQLFGDLVQLKNIDDATDFCKNLQEITEGAVSNSSIIAGLGSADGPAADRNQSYDQPPSSKLPVSSKSSLGSSRSSPGSSKSSLGSSKSSLGSSRSSLGSSRSSLGSSRSSPDSSRSSPGSSRSSPGSSKTLSSSKSKPITHSKRSAQSNSKGKTKKIKDTEDECDSSASSSVLQSQLEQHFIGKLKTHTYINTHRDNYTHKRTHKQIMYLRFSLFANFLIGKHW